MSKGTALIRTVHGNVLDCNPKTVILIGNGAVKGDGWGPARRALESHRFAFAAEGEFAAYSRLAPEIRLAHAGFFSRITILGMLREHAALDSEGYRAYVMQREANLKQIETFRNALASEYQKAVTGGELVLRSLHDEVGSLLDDDAVGVITTNWEELIWCDKRFKNVIQLHGRTGVPESLILPTECMADDENVRNLLRSQNLTANERILVEAYERNGRGRGRADELWYAYGLARNWIRDADRMLVYGIAGHIYDVELHSLLLGSGDSRWKSVVVINNNPEHVATWADLLRVRAPVLRVISKS